MDRYHLLAAEVYGYSFANYRNHLGIGNLRFEKQMPDNVRKLERTENEGWPVEKVAAVLKVDTKQAADLMRNFRRAREVVDAENPAEAFRCAVRQCIEQAVAEGLGGESSVETLVRQICYRASDLALLLQLEGKPLSRYSRHLRREPDVEYYEGYFDKEDED